MRLRPASRWSSWLRLHHWPSNTKALCDDCCPILRCFEFQSTNPMSNHLHKKQTNNSSHSSVKDLLNGCRWTDMRWDNSLMLGKKSRQEKIQRLKFSPPEMVGTVRTQFWIYRSCGSNDQRNMLVSDEDNSFVVFLISHVFYIISSILLLWLFSLLIIML